jgi:hypothetical protein
MYYVSCWTMNTKYWMFNESGKENLNHQIRHILLSIFDRYRFKCELFVRPWQTGNMNVSDRAAWLNERFCFVLAALEPNDIHYWTPKSSYVRCFSSDFSSSYLQTRAWFDKTLSAKHDTLMFPGLKCGLSFWSWTFKLTFDHIICVFTAGLWQGCSICVRKRNITQIKT